MITYCSLFCIGADWLIDWAWFLRLHQHNIGYTADGAENLTVPTHYCDVARIKANGSQTGVIIATKIACHWLAICCYACITSQLCYQATSLKSSFAYWYCCYHNVVCLSGTFMHCLQTAQDIDRFLLHTTAHVTPRSRISINFLLLKFCPKVT